MGQSCQKNQGSTLLGRMAKLRSIWAKNFRSIRELRLDDLPDVVVLFGENEAGKSNLLLAVSTLVQMLQELGPDSLHLSERVHCVRGNSTLLGSLNGSIRNGESQLELGGRFELSGESYTFTCRYRDGELQIIQAEWPEGSSPNTQCDVFLRLQSFLKCGVIAVSGQRQLSTEYLSAEPPKAVDSHGHNLKEHLFRSANHPVPDLRSRYHEHFLKMVRGGPYPEKAEPQVALTGNLIEVIAGPGRLEECGSGYRHWVILCGLIAMSGAPVALIEEPETGLSWNSQKAIAQGLRQTVAAGLVAQLFLATHSFIWLDAVADGTWFEVSNLEGCTVATRKSGRSELLERFPIDAPAVGSSNPLRVVAGGYLRLPDRALRHLDATRDSHLFCELESHQPTVRLIPDTVMDQLLSSPETSDD